MIHIDKPAPKYLPKEKRIEISEQLYDIQQGLCHKCKQPIEHGTIPHHALIHNNDVNRKRWPSLVHHFVNQVLLCPSCHQQYSCYMQIDEVAIDDVITLIAFYRDFMGYTFERIKNKIYKKFAKHINWCENGKNK